jgi:hypothetical protein
MIDILRQVDLAFIVDTTGSMGPFIQTAQQHMIDMLQGVTQAAELSIDLRVGLVEYRDHPPQDNTFVSRPYEFQANLKQVQQVINRLRPDGGGDPPEAVFDGLQAAGEGLQWRPYSRRLAVLIGDAPPHANCLCGQTNDSTTALLENQRIILYALGLTNFVESSFTALAQPTGGLYFSAGQGNTALTALADTLRQEFQDLAFDAQLLSHCQTPGWTVDALCAALDRPLGVVSAGLSRLGRRGLLSS